MRSVVCSIVVLSILVCLVRAEFRIANIDHEFSPSSEVQYAQYLQFVLGVNEDAPIDQELRQVIAKNRMSFINAKSKVILILTENALDNQQREAKNIQISGQVLQKLVYQVPQHFVIAKFAKDEKEIMENTILDYAKDKSNEIHSISGNAAEINALYEILSGKEPITANARRLSESQTETKPLIAAATNPYYITKFFFIILFVFMIVGSVMCIVNMDNGKDTLLYAKFIADVNK